MKISTFERHVEREFLNFGKQLAQPAHERIQELIDRLKVDFPITGLRMAMGAYWLLGEDVPVVYSDGSEGGTIGMTELFDCLEGTKIWCPVRLTKRHLKTLRELRQWLDWLTDAPYIPLYEFGNPKGYKRCGNQ
jgi:hypothetical protein